MKRTNIILSLCLSAICALYAIAQQPVTEPDKAKQETEKKALELVEQILAESQSLKLPENRLRIKAMAAGMLWEKDQPRARTYFQETESDLKQMIQALGNEQNNRERKADDFNRFRTELLRNLSQLDSQLALDLLHSTKLPDEYKRQYEQRYDPEVQLEAELASRAASRDPAKAAKMVEELLKKGYAMQTLNLAETLGPNEKSEVYKKLISKLATDDFLGNQEAVNIAEMLLRRANSEMQMRARMAQAQAAATTAGPARPMSSVFDDQMFRELIEVTAKAAAKNSMDNMRASNANRLKSTLQSIQPAVEKLAPAQAAALKTRPAAPGAPNAPQQQGFNPNLFSELNTMMNNPATTSDQLIEFAKKAGPQEQSQLFQQIAMRAMSKGDTEQAKQIMETYIKDPAAKERLEQMRDSMAMNNAMRKGNLEEAKQIIARIESPQRKAEQMISLSYQIAQKDKAAAAALLDEAALLLGTQVETVQQVQVMMNLSRAFGAVTPERSFDLADRIVSKFNTVIAAASIVDAFEGRNSFEQGEAKVGGGGGMYWLNNFTSNLMYLASLDFERAKTTAERFDRPETRLNALVYVASGILRPRPQPQIGAGVMPMPPTMIRR